MICALPNPEHASRQSIRIPRTNHLRYSNVVYLHAQYMHAKPLQQQHQQLACVPSFAAPLPRLAA